MEKITAILFVSFLLLLGVILYRLLLRKLSKGRIKNENYCTLYSLDKNPASGEVAFYFVSPFKIPIEFSIWEGDIKVLELSKFSPRHFEIDIDILLENSPNI